MMNNDEDHQRLGFNHASIFESTAQPTFNNAPSPDGQLATTKRSTMLHNTLNKRSPSVVSQCPFSGHKIEVDTMGV